MRKLFFTLSRKACILFWTAAVFSALVFQNCTPEVSEEPLEYRSSTEIALSWNRLALELERHTNGYRPPVSARMFAHIEMAAYEASLPALTGYRSLDAYLPGYEKPVPKFEAGQFYLPASLNAAYAQALRDFFPTAPANLRQQISQLEKQHTIAYLKNTNAALAKESAIFGKNVAIALWEWSKNDLEGHNRHLSNYDDRYVPPTCNGCWQPTGEHTTAALLPSWGKVRCFDPSDAELAVKAPVAYDVALGSGFYTEAMEVYSVSKPLSKENAWIAEFWSDDLAGLTISPAGRWISIANQAFEKARPPFPLLMETYLKTSLALFDAGIVVWKGKYQYNVARPETYIHEHINPSWESLHDSPSFPSYPSGHAAFGAAAAVVLTEALGNNFQLVDRTHENRPEFAGTPRTFNSFDEMAEENAASRVLLGVHYRMDCEEGLRIGKIIGQKMASLPLQRKEAVVMRQR